MTQTSKFLLTGEVAAQLRLSASRVRDLCRTGKLPSVRLGERKLGITQADVDAFMRRNNPAGAATPSTQEETK